MEMVRDYGPGQARGFRVGKDTAKTFKKLVPVRIILENLLTFDTPDYNVMKGTGGIDSRLTWHAVNVSQEYT
jgi:hypothetical protein